MSDFVDIRPGADAPLLLNTKNLSVIMRMPETSLTNGTKPAKMTLAIHNAMLGRQLWVDEAAWKIDPAVMVSTIESAGTHLFPIPLTWLKDKNYGTAFVNPEAFLAINTSAAYIPDGETEEHVGLLLDIAGYGRVESHSVPVKIIEDFMAQVKAAKPHLMIIDAKTATSRFSKPGIVAFDASKVSMIRPNGYDLDIHLQSDVTGSIRIDFQLLDKGKNLYSWKNNYANELLKRATARGFVWPTDPQESESRIHDFFDRAENHYQTAQARLRKTFATAIAHKNPDLVKIENTDHVYYATTKGVSAIDCTAKILTICFNNPNPQRDESLQVHCKSEEAAKNEAKRLKQLLIGP